VWAVVGVFGQPTLSRLASPFPAWARMGLSAGPACSTTKKTESVQAGQGESGGWQWKRRAHGALLVRGARAIPRAMPLALGRLVGLFLFWCAVGMWACQGRAPAHVRISVCLPFMQGGGMGAFSIAVLSQLACGRCVGLASPCLWSTPVSCSLPLHVRCHVSRVRPVICPSLCPALQTSPAAGTCNARDASDSTGRLPLVPWTALTGKGTFGDVALMDWSARGLTLAVKCNGTDCVDGDAIDNERRLHELLKTTPTTTSCPCTPSAATPLTVRCDWG
jgi:hypothetical protein